MSKSQLARIAARACNLVNAMRALLTAHAIPLDQSDEDEYESLAADLPGHIDFRRGDEVHPRDLL